MLKPPKPYNAEDYCDCDSNYRYAMGDCMDMSLTAQPICVCKNAELANIYLNNCFIGQVVIIHQTFMASIIPVTIFNKVFEDVAIEVQDYEDDWGGFPPPTYKQLIKALLWGSFFCWNSPNIDVKYTTRNQPYRLGIHTRGDLFITDDVKYGKLTKTSDLVQYILRQGHSVIIIVPTESVNYNPIVTHVPIVVENNDLLVKWLDTSVDKELYGQYGIPHLLECYGADFIANKQEYDPARVSHRVLKLQSEMHEDGIRWFADIECMGEMGPQLLMLASHKHHIELKMRGCRTITGSDEKEELIEEPVALDVYTEIELYNRKEGNNE